MISTEKNMANTIWFGVSIILFVFSIASFYLLNQMALFIRVLLLLVGIAASVALVLQSSYGKQIRLFLRDTRIELKKVVWPGRSEVIKMTVTVMISVIIIGLFLWLVDSVLLWAVQFLI